MTEKKRSSSGWATDSKGRSWDFYSSGHADRGIKSGTLEAKNATERSNAGKSGNESLVRCFGIPDATVAGWVLEWGPGPRGSKRDVSAQY